MALVQPELPQKQDTLFATSPFVCVQSGAAKVEWRKVVKILAMVNEIIIKQQGNRKGRKQKKEKKFYCVRKEKFFLLKGKKSLLQKTRRKDRQFCYFFLTYPNKCIFSWTNKFW